MRDIRRNDHLRARPDRLHHRLSSFISGVFGMAGGMVLLGVLLVYFDVATGMVLFSILQITANGWRALHWRRFVLWPIFCLVCRGLAPGVRGDAQHRLRSRQGDGLSSCSALMPFMVEVLPQSMRPNIEWRGVPFVTGIFTTVIQFLAGVGGLFLDIFFNKSRLDRKTTNATKAITQTFSHVMRAAYFGSLAGVGELKFVVWGPGIVLALVGAIAAPFVRGAHERSRLPAMDPRHHLHHRGGLSDPRRAAAVAGA